MNDCIACKKNLWEYKHEVYDDRYGYNGIFKLLRCLNCGQFQIDPLLDLNEIPALYTEYYPRRDTNANDVLSQAKQSLAPHSAIKRWLIGNNNQGQYYINPGERVLDYGCGSGVSLIEINQRGAKAYGIEADSNVNSIKRSLGLNIHIGELNDFPYGDDKFNSIIMNQVIEHIPDPENLISQLSEYLDDKGRIILSFPNANSVFRKIFRKHWINWHAPYHMHHFNARSAMIFFKAAGYEVVNIKTITPNLWTILQLRAVNEKVENGYKNPMWVGGGSSHSANKGYLNYLCDMLLKVAAKKITSIALVLFNRVVDFMGYGDSILIIIRKK